MRRRLTGKWYAPIASVAAVSDRHWQLQVLEHFRRALQLPDLSLRGGQRPTRRPEREARGSALGVQSRSTRPFVGKLSAKSQLPSRDCHVASLLAMTIRGVHRFNDSLFIPQVHHRERHAAPLQWRVRSIPPIIRGGPEWSHSGPLCFTFGYTVQWRGAGGSGSVPAPRHSAHRRCGSRSCPHRAWHRSRCLGRT